MRREFPKGVYPVMLTPFTNNNEVDYEALGKLVDWYIESGVAGLFAVCQSSEMFSLSLEERVNISRFVVERVAGRIAVISSGHISDQLEDQAYELNEITKTGVDAIILLTNRLANEEESDEVWLENLKKLMALLSEDIPLGFYECPYPYKRVMTPELLQWCAETNRFYFTKDTSCDLQNIRGKLEAIQGSNLQLYNANTATLLEALEAGASGFSGVMANFHPKLYVWLCNHFREEPEKARRVADFLTMTSFIERQVYPVNAKYYQKKLGNFNDLYTRTKSVDLLTKTCILEMEQFIRIQEWLEKDVL